MSAEWDAQRLREPIAADRPCGEDLEASGGLAALDAFQIFGQRTLDPDPAIPGGRREARASDRPPDWPAIKELAVGGLARSKDLRVLAHLSAALLRTDDVPAFCESLVVVSDWLRTNWEGVFPGLEEDLIVRRSALNCFADLHAVIVGLRRAPLVSSREHGKISLKDCEAAAAAGIAADRPDGPGTARISAAFGTLAVEELERVRDSVAGARAALLTAEVTMREHAGTEAAPDFEALTGELTNVARVVQAQLALRPGRSEDGTVEEGIVTGSAVPAAAVGVVRSREDAIRALDAVAEFFRKTEPSSPVPMFVERAKRLVSKNFLDVLADVAPAGLSEARSAGGVKDA